ncbi:MAG: ABC transporter ATP-binding protein [Bacteroidaceae bacterium]|nr:ABC transporter ATP-binding protein [Bacteroidaceae bacterium]
MYIELKNISKSFSDGNKSTRVVLDGLNLQLQKGDFVAITGKSGSGKTTLLSVLGTLLRPDSGSYTIDGLEVTAAKESMDEIRNRHIGFVFQDHRLLPQFTARENVLLPLLAHDDKVSPEMDNKSLELMERMGIVNVMNQLPETLSGGEKARVAICRALIQEPDLLLADEPTGQLDAETCLQIMNLFKEINEELGKTIVMVTHASDVAQVAKRIYQLKDGKLI